MISYSSVPAANAYINIPSFKNRWTIPRLGRAVELMPKRYIVNDNMAVWTTKAGRYITNNVLGFASKVDGLYSPYIATLIASNSATPAVTTPATEAIRIVTASLLMKRLR
jgi:hypothetical protein